jgi:hypothetical protein
MKLNRRAILRAGGGLAAATAFARPGLTVDTAATGPLPRLVVLDFEIVDTSGEARDQRAIHEARLKKATQTIRTELAGRDVYQVIDSPDLQAEIDARRAHTYLHACNGCELEIARRHGGDRVMVGAFNKISTLILSLWVTIKDVRTGAPIVHKVLDFRGDNDAAWEQVTGYLVRELAEIPPEAR